MLLSGKRVGACSALRWDERQQLYRCGALTDPVGVLPRGLRWLAGALRRLARRWIAAGIGCDAALSVHVPPKR
jgi:hypothetical protein